MSRETWDWIKQSKGFYISVYRRLAKTLLFSIGLNFILLIAINYIYFTQPENDYYATSGVTPPIKLTGLNTPNYSSEPLLPADPEDDMGQKAIPE